jgi:phosphoribosylglycinamide formyltransferase-1
VKRVAILISGGGSNMVALVQHDRGSSGAAGAGGLERPGGRGWPRRRRWAWRRRPSITAPSAATAPRSRPLLRQSLAAQPDILCLAGFMRVLTPGFRRRFEGRMLNIHPSLLPKYPGLHTHAARAGGGRYRGRLHRA